ncbi:MAG: PIG-L family deacetylase [Acidobacteria bacterium]|nr:PIG-L family deacetylase [Acidobacteriota bacterium]
MPRWLVFCAILCAPLGASERTILSIGAHAGDAELTTGAVLAAHKKLGDRIVLAHLSLGEGGNPKLPPRLYGEQKRREAREAAAALGAEVIFGPFKDGEVPNNDEARRWVAGLIRQVKPTHIFTHWRAGIHKDHIATHAVVVDAVLLASLEGYDTGHPPHRGVRGVYFAENWEDSEGFQPYLYFDVSDALAVWREAAVKYQFVRGGVVPFRYLDYYEGLARVRGAQASRRFAVACDVAPEAKKRVLGTLP